MSKVTDAVYNQGVITVPPPASPGDTGTLPFTGVDLGVFAIAAFALVAAGLGLRRASRQFAG